MALLPMKKKDLISSTNSTEENTTHTCLEDAILDALFIITVIYQAMYFYESDPVIIHSYRRNELVNKGRLIKMWMKDHDL